MRAPLRHRPAKLPAPARRSPCPGKGKSRSLRVLIPLGSSPGRAGTGTSTPSATLQMLLGLRSHRGGLPAAASRLPNLGQPRQLRPPGQTRMLFSPKVQHRNDKRPWCSRWAESQDAAVKFLPGLRLQVLAGWEWQGAATLVLVQSPECP